MSSSARAIRAASPRPAPSGAGSNGWSARERKGAVGPSSSASPEVYFSPIAPVSPSARPTAAPPRPPRPPLPRPRPAPGDDPGGDHRDPQPSPQRRVEDRAEDDGGLRADLLPH